MVGNVTVNDENDVQSKKLSQIHSYGISYLKNVRTGAYVAQIDFLVNLRDNLGYKFSEMRIGCTKASHGRQVDIAFLGQLVEDLLIPNAARDISVEGGDFRPLPNDNSLLTDAAKGATARKKKGASFYYLPINKHGFVQIDISSRMECDDHNSDDVFGVAGNWKFYVK